MTTLFRQQILEARTSASALYGEPRINVAPQWSAFIGIIFLFFAVAAIVAMTVDISRKERVRGQLKYLDAEARIYTEVRGVLTLSDLPENGQVSAGDVIATISTDRYLGDGEPLSQQGAQSLQDEITALDTLRDVRQTAVRTSSEALAAQKASHERDIAAKQAEIATVRDRLIEARAQVNKMRGFLEEGLVAALEVERARTTARQYEDQLAGLEEQVRQLRARHDQIEPQDAQLWSDLDAELAQIAREIIQLKRRLNENTLSADYQVVAPISGRISSLLPRNGSTVREGQFLFNIAPLNAELVAEVLIPSNSIALVRPDQAINIRYDALPFERYGVQHGQLGSISSTALPPEDVGRTGSQYLYYPAIIHLNSQTVETNSVNVPLISGMEFSADIKLEERSMLSFLLPRLSPDDLVGAL